MENELELIKGGTSVGGCTCSCSCACGDTEGSDTTSRLKSTSQTSLSSASSAFSSGV